MTQLTLIAADGKKTEIVDLPCVIGRTKANGLVLESDRVSRQHAKFDRDGNGLIVVDLGSPTEPTSMGFELPRDPRSGPVTSCNSQT